MVFKCLSANADEAFIATGISRKIERSSGAIANILTAMAKQGTVR